MKKPLRRHLNSKLSLSETLIVKMPVDKLINEFNLIRLKKSRLSAHLREVVKLRIEFLKEKGVILTKEKDLNDSEQKND